MQLGLDNSPANTIVAYDTGLIRVHSRSTQDTSRTAAAVTVVEIRTSVIITPDHIIDSWQADSRSELLPQHIRAVLELEPELIILGTGSHLRFPAAAITQICHEAGVGVEVMNTGAACRTYNILAGEGRRVAAALLMIGE